jgi:hypothetical protein
MGALNMLNLLPAKEELAPHRFERRDTLDMRPVTRSNRAK